jgi:endonuclease-3 related protein
MKGIGPETADSIILYAANKPIFVVDAYTKRLCKRLPLETETFYDEIQNYFQKNLEKNFDEKELTKIYNNLHAMIVMLAKNYCKKTPVCNNCPLKIECKYYKDKLS